MRSMKNSWRGLISVMAIALGGSASMAADVLVFSTIGVRSVLEELTPAIEQATHHRLVITYGLASVLAKRVRAGEAPDVLISTRADIDALGKSGRVVAGSIRPLAGSGIGLAVRKGAAKPDVSTPEALKRTLLAAKSLSYSDPAAGGASGMHFAQVLAMLDIAEAMKPKTTFPAPGGSTGELASTSVVELAIQQIPELLELAGVDYVGPLPGGLQKVTHFAGAIPVDAKDAQAAGVVLSYLLTKEARQIMVARGLQPEP